MGSEEIDRLQTSALEMIDGRDAEIERLKAALTKIADPDISWGHMKKIARDALCEYEQSPG